MGIVKIKRCKEVGEDKEKVGVTTVIGPWPLCKGIH